MAGKQWKRWSADEEEIIRREYEAISRPELAKRLGVTIDVLGQKAKKLGLNKPPPFEWTEEMLTVLREQYQTKGPTQLANELKIPYWVLLSKAKRLGIGATRKLPPKDFEWTEEILQDFRDRYVTEGGQVFVEKYNLSIDAVRRKASELGLRTTVGHVLRGQKDAESNQDYVLDYFDQWSPDMAYVLGFLFADGTIGKNLKGVGILIASKDEAVLEFIRSQICPEKKIYRYDAKVDDRGSVTQPQSYLVLGSKVLVRRLMSLGMMPHKTYNDDPYPEIPDEMFPHFVRGYLDGDGCTSINNRDVCTISFVGSVGFITGLAQQLQNLANIRTSLVYVIKGKKTDYATVKWSAAEDIRKFFAFAYPEGFSFCLERKRANLVKWLSVPRLGRGQHMKRNSNPT